MNFLLDDVPVLIQQLLLFVCRNFHVAHLLANVKNKVVAVLVKQILRMCINYVKNFGENWVFLCEDHFGRIVLRHC